MVIMIVKMALMNTIAVSSVSLPAQISLVNNLLNTFWHQFTAFGTVCYLRGN